MLADEHSVLRQAQANTSPEVLFPSALAGRAALPRAATPRGHPASTLIRPCGFFAKRNRESAGVRSGAAWPRESNASPIHFRRPHRVMHRRASLPSDVPLPARAFATSPESNRRTAHPAADFSVGQTLHLRRADVSARPNRTSRSTGAGLKVPAHHQARVRGRRLARRHSWDSDPSQVCSRCGCGPVSSAAGLRAVCRLLAAINFRRGIVRPKEICSKKDGRL